MLLLAASVSAAGEAPDDRTGWWPPFVPRQDWIARPATPAAGEQLVLDRPLLAGLSGFRQDWDRSIMLAENGAMRTIDKGEYGKGLAADWSSKRPGAIAFDAVHRSLLVRFPEAAAKLAEALAKNEIVRLELVLPFAGTEIHPPNYQDPPALSFLGSLWVDRKPRWSAVAYALRRSWTPDPASGPTYNAFLNGRGWWAQFGAASREHDHFPVPFGPAEVSSAVPEGRLDVTGILTDKTFGETVGERLRVLADCGFIVRKTEVYDASFWPGGYEWGTATGGRAILIKTPKLVATLKPSGGIEVRLPPGLSAASQASQWKGARTAFLPDEAQIAGFIKRYAFQKAAWMDDGVWKRVQELYALGGGSARMNDTSFPTSVADYHAWLDGILGTAPRTYCCYDIPQNFTLMRRYWDTLPEPVRENMRLNYWAWLLPDREHAGMAHGCVGGNEARAYYDRTRDWRGNFSVYRTYCWTMGPQDFNMWCVLATHCGGWLLDSPRMRADATSGIDRFLLRTWSWADGSSQETVDHYYWAISIASQKALADFAATWPDRMMGRSILARTMTDMIGVYHPNLKRFTATSDRTCPAYTCIIQDGLQSVMHTVDPAGAMLDTDARKVENGVPTIGHDFAPRKVAVQTLHGPWGSSWFGNLVANRKWPYTARANHWGGSFVVSFQASDYGLASKDNRSGNDFGTVPFIAHWRREPRVARSYRDVATLLGRYGVNRTNLLSAGGGHLTGPQAGTTQCFQHRSRAFILGHACKSLQGGSKKEPPASVASTQFTFGLLAFAAKPKLRIDGREVGTLPASASLGQRIVIHDGVSYCAILPLLATDLGRDLEVEIVGDCAPMKMQGGGTLAEYLRIDIFNHRGSSRLDLSRADQGVVVAGIQMGSAETFKSVEDFESALASNPAKASIDPRSLAVQAVWKGADGTMELEWLPGSENQLKRRVVDGQPVTLPKETERECDLMIQGGGTLTKNGATLVLGKSQGLLIADPVGRCYEGWNGLPHPVPFAMTVPGGAAASDGLVSTCRVFMDLKNNRVEVDAVVPERNGARSMVVTGLSAGATVVVNGRTVKVSPGAIPLATPPLDPGEGASDEASAGHRRNGLPAAGGQTAAKNDPGPEARDHAGVKDAEPAGIVTVSAEAERKWNRRLFLRVREALAGRERKPNFTSAMIRSKVVIQSMDEQGRMSIGVEGSGSVSQAWDTLKPGELKEIALSMVRPDSASDSALAAFFCLVVGDRRAADKHLGTAGAAAAEVVADTGGPPGATEIGKKEAAVGK